MSDKTPLRIVDYTKGEVKRPDNAEGGAQGRRALSSLDRVVLYLLLAALLLAPFGAGLFATPNIISPPQGMLGWMQDVGGSLIGILAALALGVAVWREWKRPVAIGPVAGLAGGGILLAVWSLVSLLTHSPPSNTGVDCLAALLAALIVGGLISRVGRDQKALLMLLLAVVAAGSLVGAIGVREYMEQWKQTSGSHRVFGTFIGPNFLAGYLLLTLPITLACFVAARERLSRLLLGLGLFLQTACLLLTGSRAGAAMLFVVLLAWLFLVARAEVILPNGRQIIMGFALMFVAALLASAPLFLRVAGGKPQEGKSVGVANIAAAAEAQEHSGKFRQYTWLGTIKMAQANPLAGTGIGSYETAYPRYAQTGFTAHAHNSLLQWTAETGLPGVFFLLVILASSTAFGAYVLFLNAPALRRGDEDRERGKEGKEKTATDNGEDLSLSPLLLVSSSPPLPYGFVEPRLLLAGLLAAVLSTTLHSLFDSDWYIVATALTLSAVIGLMAALSRNLAPLATQAPRPLSRLMLAACGCVALVLLWRTGTTYAARFDLAQGQEHVAEFQEQAAHGNAQARVSLDSAVENYHSAAALDPFNPEPLLMLGSLYQSLGQPDKAQDALLQAVRVAPTGKTYYQLGQFHKRQALRGEGNKAPDENPIALSGTNAATGDVSQTEVKAAMDAFSSSRDRDPHSLQTLRWLAETYALAGNASESMQIYRDITSLETTPLGTVRAMPERIETDFAYAHARLASAMAKDKPIESLAEYQKAGDLLKSYWTSRRSSYYDLLTPDKRRGLNDLYAAVLNGRLEVLKASNPSDSGHIVQVQAEQAAFEQDKATDAESERKAQAEQAAQQGSPTP